jgi:hypothetical protein
MIEAATSLLNPIRRNQAFLCIGADRSGISDAAVDLEVASSVMAETFPGHHDSDSKTRMPGMKLGLTSYGRNCPTADR